MNTLVHLKKAILIGLAVAATTIGLMAIQPQQAHADVNLNCSANTACTTTTVVTTYVNPVINKIQDYLPLMVAVLVTVSALMWLVRIILRFARLRRA